MNIFDEYIMEFDNICPDSLCDEITTLFESNDFKKRDGEIGAHRVIKEIKDSVDGNLNLENTYQYTLNSKLLGIVNKGKEAYIKKSKECGLDKNLLYFSSSNTGVMEGVIRSSKCCRFQIQRTSKKGFYDWHSDFSPDEPRVLTYILYLNDLEEDAGGETCFISGKCVKPKKGKMLIFPTSLCYLHKGGVLKKGVKYIATTFSVFSKVNSPINGSTFTSSGHKCPFIFK
jgi:hypothetical protein